MDGILSDILRKIPDRSKRERCLLEQIQNAVQLVPMQMALCAGGVFLAGVVRGFSGFALSALVMASMALILAPIELIPICFVIEAVASLIMFRRGVADADMTIVWGLTIGSIVGTPVGLFATTVLPVETSKVVVLCIILGLAGAQLLRVRPKILARTSGLYASGIAAGLATGLAAVGGMVVALYVLAREAPSRTMRASLVVYISIGMFTTLAYLLGFGLMNQLAILRGLLLAPFVTAGVLTGSAMFRPSFEAAYKKFCLFLLIFLASTGLLRMAF
jgi:uncharacterized membrane protein YfcA